MSLIGLFERKKKDTWLLKAFFFSIPPLQGSMHMPFSVLIIALLMQIPTTEAFIARLTY